jgi:hypothetical protein
MPDPAVTPRPGTSAQNIAIAAIRTVAAFGVLAERDLEVNAALAPPSAAHHRRVAAAPQGDHSHTRGAVLRETTPLLRLSVSSRVGTVGETTARSWMEQSIDVGCALLQLVPSGSEG